MSTIKNALGTLNGLLGAVDVSVRGGVKLVNTGAKSLDMADRWVTEAGIRQVADYKVQRKNYAKHAVINGRKDDARFMADLDRELQADPEMARYYNDSKGEYDALLSEIENDIASL